jgi:hypothetical protein
MVPLHIALQEGFTGEPVIIRINGKEAYRREKVNTKFQIGYADSFEVNVDEGQVKVEVLLPTKGLSETFEMEVSNPTYIGVSIDQGRIGHRISPQPFGYL